MRHADAHPIGNLRRCYTGHRRGAEVRIAPRRYLRRGEHAPSCPLGRTSARRSAYVRVSAANCQLPPPESRFPMPDFGLHLEHAAPSSRVEFEGYSGQLQAEHPLAVSVVFSLRLAVTAWIRSRMLGVGRRRPLAVRMIGPYFHYGSTYARTECSKYSCTADGGSGATTGTYSRVTVAV